MTLTLIKLMAFWESQIMLAGWMQRLKWGKTKLAFWDTRPKLTWSFYLLRVRLSRATPGTQFPSWTGREARLSALWPLPWSVGWSSPGSTRPPSKARWLKCPPMIIRLSASCHVFVVKVLTVQEMFGRHLMQLPGLSADKAAVILEEYPTLHRYLIQLRVPHLTQVTYTARSTPPYTGTLYS